MISPSPGSHQFFCSDCSRAAGEQVFGTAPVADVWLALEYRRLWSRKALEDNGLPPAVQARLGAEIAGARTRPLLIRQPGRLDSDRLFFVAVVDEVAPRLYRFALKNHADLLALDLPAIVAGDGRYADHLVSEPLYLVCTNGKRDRACSRDGLPVFQALAAQVPAGAWQSTHLGGHRFAATLLTLPDGMSYGYLTPRDVEPLVRLAQAGRVDVPHLRGRTCYSRPVQAAEYYLRDGTGIDALPGFRLASVRDLSPTRWRVTFEALADDARHTFASGDRHTFASGDLHTLDLAAEDTVDVVLSSTDSEFTAQPQYTLLRHTIEKL
ncbi:MAG: hypothetical protein JXN59_00500 [Anaerolineae bacterium]|nr:hypothetical protein [Anaerolineae bacterium]